VKAKVAVITKIGYDHIEILGKTLKKIAKEKAGIIHPAPMHTRPKIISQYSRNDYRQFEHRCGASPSSFVVISPQRPSALKIIKDKIQATNNQYYDIQKELQVTNIKTNLTGSQFTIKDKNGIVGKPRTNFTSEQSFQTTIYTGTNKTQKLVRGKYKINLIGKHQIENAVTALAVLRYLHTQDLRITKNGIRNGLANTQISARCQIISKNPLIVIDSAHNPDSAKSLYDVINNTIKQKVIIVFGASQGKLVKEIFKILAPVTKLFILTQSENPRHIPSSELAKLLSKFSVSFQITENVSDAIKQGFNLSKGRTPIIITGSFYVASEALITLNLS